MIEHKTTPKKKTWVTALAWVIAVGLILFFAGNMETEEETYDTLYGQRLAMELIEAELLEEAPEGSEPIGQEGNYYRLSITAVNEGNFAVYDESYLFRIYLSETDLYADEIVEYGATTQTEWAGNACLPPARKGIFYRTVFVPEGTKSLDIECNQGEDLQTYNLPL